MSTKPFDIPKQLVWKAWQHVRANRGSGGVDGESITEFELHLEDNLYRIWNLMSSGSYFPPDARGVEIPKAKGGTRLLGIPTISDRVAQATVKLQIEERLEKVFLPDSYGYRPGKSAFDAVSITRSRCWKWKWKWCLEFDIRAMFDRIPHELVMKAVKKHVPEKWCELLISRWLKAGIRLPSGERKERNTGTPQGGVLLHKLHKAERPSVGSQPYRDQLLATSSLETLPIPRRLGDDRRQEELKELARCTSLGFQST